MISLIVAHAANYAIGKDNDLIWHLSEDLKRFKSLTTGHHIIMGRKNYESIGRLLPNRTSVIVTRNKSYNVLGAKIVHSLEDAIDVSKNDNEIFIIGGASLYQEALDKDIIDKMYITELKETFEGDVNFPKFDMSKWDIESKTDWMFSEKSNLNYRFINYLKKT